MVIKMNQRVALTKRLIKDGLLLLLKNKDIQQISVKELCETAQVNRSTFYTHYGTPRDVLIDIERDALEDLNMETCRTREDIRSHLVRMCEYLYKHRETQRLIMKNNTDEEVAQTLADPIFSFYVPAAFLGDLSGRDPADVSLCASFLTFGMYHVLKDWLLSNIEKTPEEIGNLMADMVLR